jgi:hypothetical protein
MGADEEGTFERLKALRRELFDPKVSSTTAALTPSKQRSLCRPTRRSLPGKADTAG